MWWHWWPNMNIGISTGQACGFIALDVDPDHGGDDTLRNLEKQYGSCRSRSVKLPVLAASILFRHVPRLRNSAGLIGPARYPRNGGYIVVAPNMHVCGRRYAGRWTTIPSMFRS